MNVMSINEKYMIFYMGGTAYVGRLGHGFKPHISIFIPIWCVMDCPFQWYVEVEILVVLIGLVHNDWLHEEFPIISVQDN